MENTIKKKLIRTATVPISLDILLRGQLNFLKKGGYEIIAVSGEGKRLRNLGKREGVCVFPIEMERSISLIKDLISLWKLYIYFKKEKPYIVHSITPKAGLLSMVAAYFSGVPIRMHTFTGLIFPTREGLFQKVLICMDKVTCYFATNIFPEGQGVKNDLIRFNITNKPLKVLANGNINGIDVNFFNMNQFSFEQLTGLKEQLNINFDDFIFIFVGRLVSDKGINELIKAFKKLNRDNIKLLLVGSLETELDPLSEETLSEIQNNKNIISVGFQKDVRPYFAISNVLVFPSYREGFPNVVMQAGAMGLPSIVTNINGCNEIIIEDVNGTVISVKDDEAVFIAMEKIFKDKDWRNYLKSNARKMIVDRYEQKVVWEAILAEYKKLEKHV